ncbi:flagellar motor switch protein FliN [Alteribacter lacisalsi]|uniref:flagellar motor switch protein FliN n=1 Tax=Alteribacter lacisalsi TaxID=2045244 RepID=UPI0026A0116B
MTDDRLSQEEIDALLNGIDEAEKTGEDRDTGEPVDTVDQEIPADSEARGDKSEPETADALENDGSEHSIKVEQSREEGAVSSAAFSEFNQSSEPAREGENLGMLLDIPLEVTVELGRTRRSIREILELTKGSVLELDKLAGEPVDVMINKKLVARGEVVVIDENFGVRVTDIVSQRDRINKLK